MKEISMYIQTTMENCSYEVAFLSDIEESKIQLRLEIETVASIQSRKSTIDETKNEIQKELLKFKWIITGAILVQFAWYLDGVARQETSKIGDMDNISKPIQDALTGANGIIIDDCQIKNLETLWLTKNQSVQKHILGIEIRFTNSETQLKSNLHFIQFDGPMCLPINFDPTKIDELINAKLYLSGFKRLRRIASRFKNMNVNADQYLVVNSYVFHKTRLNGFDTNQILKTDELNKLCFNTGLTLSSFIKKIKKGKLNLS
ncbi:RusA family crossover junction endodeoxyribonuclease [Chitinophaga rhizophila]|uniref:RusA family crossover junction endodeoxyribonuclease n=1 Tax=Chitinophaga rhizophila TaxID=2866212 RepID=A0ABS7G8V1_9BACT|nr:RusA family crossover junction endodeoxyribonuclease [Chitinophaga rhizophila]MBW8683555.1 RusA family crossover junction endodeoxyribonuclease [Chitinophaga rhizophila]